MCSHTSAAGCRLWCFYRLLLLQLVKQLWVYIRANELQNPECKRDIICDAKLKKIFNGESQVGAGSG